MSRRLSLTTILVILCLLTSCATIPVSKPALTLGMDPSPTPFQPGGNDPLLDAPLAPLTSPTFTPYPTVPVRSGTFSIPQVSTPSGASDLSDLEIDPLTGLPPSDPNLLNRRPLAIKISNYPREIRPQYGLTLADVVFEYYIEWFDTRFIGIFYGNNAKQIGPVRSGRYFDEHITRMFHAYYVFNFADPRELDYFWGGDLQHFLVTPGCATCKCPPFMTDHVSANIVDVSHYETYFDSTRFSDCLASKNQDNNRPTLRNGFFSTAVPPNGVAVDKIFTHYSFCDYNYWQYDPQSTRYQRFQEISPNQKAAHIDDCSDNPETYAPLMDALTHKQVAADNVVVLFVAHTFANQNEQQDEIYHINLVDSGTAFVFRDGLAYPARWMRTDITQPLLITTPSLVPVYLKPGQTFYQVIGETSTDWSDGLDWHFDFHTP